jgi:hypothetical protein
MGLEKCKLIDLPKITDPRGDLSFIEGNRHVPFEIKRIFYLYDVPTGESRGAHAHKTLEQFLICLSGSFNVYVDDGKNKKTYHLNRPWQGLYIPPMIWSWEGDFDPGTVCLVLASSLYNRDDYYYDYDLFLEAIKEVE